MPQILSSALVALVALVWLVGCGDPSQLVTIGDDSDYAVVVAPATARLEHIGATRQFSAAVLLDGLLVEEEPEWSSADFAVVTVGADGVAVAQGAGQTFVIAAVGYAADSAVVSVDFVSIGEPPP